MGPTQKDLPDLVSMHGVYLGPDERLSLPKMLSGANAFEISDIEG